jgi:carbamate kinase
LVKYHLPRPSVFFLSRYIREIRHGKSNAVRIAAGGGIPVATATDGQTPCGVEAVIDKDLCSALTAADIDTDPLLIATDVDAVYAGWHTTRERVLRGVSVAGLQSMSFPAGSMGPKVETACEFASHSGRPAIIGSLDRIEQMASGTAGPRITR